MGREEVDLGFREFEGHTIWKASLRNGIQVMNTKVGTVFWMGL